jgi:hypothetical protein
MLIKLLNFYNCMLKFLASNFFLKISEVFVTVRFPNSTANPAVHMAYIIILLSWYHIMHMTLVLQWGGNWEDEMRMFLHSQCFFKDFFTVHTICTFDQMYSILNTEIKKHCLFSRCFNFNCTSVLTVWAEWISNELERSWNYSETTKQGRYKRAKACIHEGNTKEDNSGNVVFKWNIHGSAGK